MDLYDAMANDPTNAVDPTGLVPAFVNFAMLTQKTSKPIDPITVTGYKNLQWGGGDAGTTVIVPPFQPPFFPIFGAKDGFNTNLVRYGSPTTWGDGGSIRLSLVVPPVDPAEAGSRLFKVEVEYQFSMLSASSRNFIFWKINQTHLGNGLRASGALTTTGAWQTDFKVLGFHVFVTASTKDTKFTTFCEVIPQVWVFSRTAGR